MKEKWWLYYDMLIRINKCVRTHVEIAHMCAHTCAVWHYCLIHASAFSLSLVFMSEAIDEWCSMNACVMRQKTVFYEGYCLLLLSFCDFFYSFIAVCKKKCNFVSHLVLRTIENCWSELRWECSENLRHYPMLWVLF